VSDTPIAKKQEMTAIAPSFAILTLGCKVNQYESQELRERMARAGCREDRADPELLIVNTCAVTARAEAKARKLIRRKLAEFPRAGIVIVGCGLRYSRLLGRDLEKLVPPPLRGRLPFSPAGEGLRATTFSAGRSRPLVKAQDGCDAFCAYCVIPLVRGRPVSRPAAGVIAEIAGLVEAGYREIVLTGINLGLYRDRDLDLAGLVERACRLPGDFRLRLSSVEPGEKTAVLGRLIASESRLCPHLHLPLQSGSDRVLKLMNRGYTIGGYRELAARLRSASPDLALSTDCLVGFPGESEADFQLTCRAVEELGFSRVHIFPYSSRPLTEASKAPAPPRETVKARVSILEKTALRAADRYRERFRGETVEVLVESLSGAGEGSGLERHYLRTVIRGPGLRPGGIFRGRVAGIEQDELRAELVSK
jgi:threonylcarbamoyladenosine tRNA methylthiotransferase MtaB